MILMLPAAGCMSAGNPDPGQGAAICDASRAARRDHAAALAADGGARSVLTGARLIRLIDAGCAE